MKKTDGMGRAELLARLDELEAQKNAAYAERDRCVALIAASARRLGHAVGLAEHPAEDTTWDPEWRTIVFVELPTGQASWHVHDSERAWFEGLAAYPTPWDGHTTEEKYERVAETTREWLAAAVAREDIDRAIVDYATKAASLANIVETAKDLPPMTLSERHHAIRVEWAAGFVARRAELATSESLRMRIDTLDQILGEEFTRDPKEPPAIKVSTFKRCGRCGGVTGADDPMDDYPCIPNIESCKASGITYTESLDPALHAWTLGAGVTCPCCAGYHTCLSALPFAPPAVKS